MDSTEQVSLLHDLEPSLSILVGLLLEVLLQSPLDFIGRVICTDMLIPLSIMKRTWPTNMSGKCRLGCIILGLRLIWEGGLSFPDHVIKDVHFLHT